MAEGVKEDELKYVDRINISTLSITEIKGVIKDDIKATLAAWAKPDTVNMEKQCYHIIGPAGVGKTQICHQIAQELSQEHGIKFEVKMIKAPVLSRDDFIIPFPIMEKDSTMRSFNMLYSDFVPKDPTSFGLFVVDEFSRGDHALQQLLWQVQNEYKLHIHDFPKGWFVITTDNPDDAEYVTDTLEDAAGLRRQLHLYVEANALDFLNYAIANGFHPYVVEFIQMYPDRLYDFTSQKRGSVYANPASWEKLSNLMKKMEILHKAVDFDKLVPLASGLLNTHMARLFIEFARDKKDINPKDVFYRYPDVKSKVEALVKENNNSKLSELMAAFCSFLATTKPKYDTVNLRNVMDFLSTIPVDTAALFITQIDTYNRRGPEFRYLVTLNGVLQDQDPRWKKDFYEPLMKCSKAGQSA
jgi:DNA polymerase III delta prime subunit